jgi:S-layer homology domain
MRTPRFVTTALILLSMLSAHTALAFTDVPVGTVQSEAIADLRSRGIVNGYADGTYRPEQLMNRAEFLKMLVLSRVTEAEIDELLARIRISALGDVPSGAWYWRYITYARARGIVEGYPDGLFRPEQTVNTAEASKIAVNVFDVTKPTINCFRTCEWWLVYVEAMNRNSILPTSASLPTHIVTRGEMAIIIRNLLTMLGHSASSAGCVVGGCSGQLCVEAGLDDVVSTCEWRNEYACYQTAVCARQANGLCGWSQTVQLRACLQQNAATN